MRYFDCGPIHLELYNNGDSKWLFLTASLSWCFKHHKFERWAL